MAETPITYSENHEKLLEAWLKSENRENTVDDLIPIIRNISITGVTCLPWESLKQLLLQKINKVLLEFNAKTPLEKFEAERNTLNQLLLNFKAPPFTIQRLCELLLAPEMYVNTKRYAAALDKVLNVSGTQPTLSKKDYNDTVAEQILKIFSIKQIRLKNELVKQEEQKENPNHHEVVKQEMEIDENSPLTPVTSSPLSVQTVASPNVIKTEVAAGGETKMEVEQEGTSPTTNTTEESVINNNNPLDKMDEGK